METIVQQLGLQYLQMIPPAIVGLCLIYFLLRYLWLYRRPACTVRKELQAIHQQIVLLQPEQAEACLHKLKEIFATASASLKSAWNEYGETLHQNMPRSMANIGYPRYAPPFNPPSFLARKIW